MAEVSVLTSPRLGIYREIETQVHVANEEHGGPAHDDKHPAYEWVEMIEYHATQSLYAGHVGAVIGFSTLNAGERIQYRRQMIRVAQLAIAAIETLERHEATLPKRRLVDAV